MSLLITISMRPAVGGSGAATCWLSSSSVRERSKLPEGLKATETVTSLCDLEGVLVTAVGLQAGEGFNGALFMGETRDKKLEAVESAIKV